MRAFEEFLMYKSRIPVRGAIMLNEEMDAAVLVKGWKKGANWSFPRGKINKEEDDMTCALREVYEETGYDLEAAGLVPEDRDVKYIEINMREQQMRLYVFRSVPMDTHFETRTRKEISKIQWWRLSELPAFRKKNQQQQHQIAVNANKFYMVAPFLVPLKKWVVEQRKDAKRAVENQYLSAGMSHDEVFTEDDPGVESNTQGRAQATTAMPELNTLEGATAALSRLLKIQPATQGLQVEAMAGQSPTVKNSGEALLALLHGKSPLTEEHLKPILILGTPLDHTTVHAQTPSTPHHYQPRFPPRASISPPSFHFQPPQHPVSYHQSNYQSSNSGNQHTASQAYAQRSQGAPRLYQPQPLPPHVQRAVFTGGTVHSPAMPQPTQQSSLLHLHAHGSVALSNTQFSGVHAPMTPKMFQEAPRNLTSHSLALLNAFKSQDQVNGNSDGHSNLLLRGYTEAPDHPPQPQPQELPAALPAKLAMEPRTNYNFSPATSKTKVPINESHRATLLEMFKSPTTPNAALSNTAAATALPVTTMPSAVELSAVEPLSSNTGPRTTPLNHQQRGLGLDADNIGVPELNPEATLPFRATSILQRPPLVDDAGTAVSGSSYGARTNEKRASSGVTRRQIRKSPEKSFQPQILRRPQPTHLEKTELPEAVPIQPPDSGNPTMPAPPSLDRRSTQPTEQKQTLLSLFGKSSSPASALFGTATTDGLLMLPHENAGLNSSAQVKVEFSTTGNSPGVSLPMAQSSISPADKGFLLSYLDAVAKGSQ